MSEVENYKAKAKRKRLLGKPAVSEVKEEGPRVVIPWFSVANQKGAGRKRRVTAHKPGDIIEMRDGRKYEVVQSGAWKRVRE